MNTNTCSSSLSYVFYTPSLISLHSPFAHLSPHLPLRCLLSHSHANLFDRFFCLSNLVLVSISCQVWDNEVANLAQRWADNCKFAHDKIRSIPGRFAVGQNLATGQNDWGDAVQAWYSEIEDFTYGNKSLNKLKLVGHFTQVFRPRVYNI